MELCWSLDNEDPLLFQGVPDFVCGVQTRKWVAFDVNALPSPYPAGPDEGMPSRRNLQGREFYNIDYWLLSLTCRSGKKGMYGA